MHRFTESRVIRWYRKGWASTSTLGRTGLALFAFVSVISGFVLLQIAYGMWRDRGSVVGAVGAMTFAFVGVIWVSAFLASFTAEAEPAAAVTAEEAVDENSQGTVASTTTAPSTPTSTVATTTTTRPTTTTTRPAPTSTTTVITETEPVEVDAGDDDLVISLLATIPIAREVQSGYDRSLFEHWTDADRDGCDTRDDVLIRDAGGSAQVDGYGCAVVAGDWYSPYDGKRHTDPSELQIDHVVALKEAWDSGAHSWSPQRREAFANDLDEPGALIAVTGSVNQSEGQADPSNWLPPNQADTCRYLTAWVRVKAKWGLSMDQSEYGRIENLLERDCAGQKVGAVLVVAPAATVAKPKPTTTATTQPKPKPASTTTTVAPSTTTTKASGGGCDPSYPTICIPVGVPDLDCGDISHRKFKVLPPDPHRFDGNDNDGWGCES